MNKKIFVSLNNTLLNTNKAIVEIYNKRYVKEADVNNIKQFNLLDECIYLGENFKGNAGSEISDILKSNAFWKCAEFNPSAIEVLTQLKTEGYELVLVVDGEEIVWLKPFMELSQMKLNMFEKIVCVDKNRKDKSIKEIDMDGCFFIGNEVAKLQESNAQTRIVFGKELKGNRNPGYFRIMTWVDAPRYIQQVYEANQY